MTINVFILCTCRKPELLPYSVMVFDSIKVGFPTANVTVFLNRLEPEANEFVSQKVKSFGGLCQDTDTIHHEWIEKLVKEQTEPFYVVDTDVIFYENFERNVFETSLAGWRIPEWKDEFSNSITRSRLHTSVLYINPVKVREEIEKYRSQFPVTLFTPQINLFHPICLPFNGNGYFYDTCSLLYHAIGGQEFSDDQLDKYFHFNFGTISDMVLPLLSNGGNIDKRRQEILKNPSLGRGLWNEYREYIAERQVQHDGGDVITPIDPKDLEDAYKWNVELCLGNKEAMLFNDLWYSYVHGIDDLVDTLQDGRPTMSREQMISLFMKAAIFYNSKFYLQHKDLLFPIILEVTNMFKVSCAWEKSPKSHLRAMGDVFRTCGNRMYSMVALICGGEAHMLKMTLAINERDYLGQHDANGKPI